MISFLKKIRIDRRKDRSGGGRRQRQIAQKPARVYLYIEPSPVFCTYISLFPLYWRPENDR